MENEVSDRCKHLRINPIISNNRSSLWRNTSLEKMESVTHLEQMKAEVGITEELKTSDQMKWVGLMNNVRSSAEEIVLDELIYV